MLSCGTGLYDLVFWIILEYWIPLSYFGLRFPLGIQNPTCFSTPSQVTGSVFCAKFSEKNYESKLASLYNDGGTDDVCDIIRNILGPLLSKYVKLVLFDSKVYPITWMSLAWNFCFVVLSIIHVSIEFSIDMGAGRFWCPTRSHP